MIFHIFLGNFVNVEEGAHLSRRRLYERYQLQLKVLMRLMVTNYVSIPLKLELFSLVDAYATP